MTDFPRPLSLDDAFAESEPTPSPSLTPTRIVRFPRPACFGELDRAGSPITSVEEMTEIEIDRGLARMLAEEFGS